MRSWVHFDRYSVLSLVPPLMPGAPLAIVAPASAPRNPDRMTRGLDALRADGLEVVWEPDELTPSGYLAGSDAQRAQTVTEALRRYSHIMCVRGGYGCLRLLDAINYSALQCNHALVIGFSDVTALQLALYQKCGWHSLSGPVVVEWGEIPDSMKQECLALLRGAIADPVANLAPIQTGTQTGPLIGGNLATFVRLVGTPYLPPMDQAILFVEDVNEPPYRVDALFAQLHLAGILARIGGLVVGRFTGQYDQDAYRPVLRHYSRMYSWPLACGLEYGHFHPRRILPIGVLSRLTVRRDHARLDILEPVTAAA